MSLGSCAWVDVDGVGSGTFALESRQLDHPPRATASAASGTRLASWEAIRKAPML
jgi:hypothetical protein